MYFAGAFLSYVFLLTFMISPLH